MNFYPPSVHLMSDFDEISCNDLLVILLVFMIFVKIGAGVAELLLEI